MILVTGETIPIAKRIGLLDRKLRVVSENTETEEEAIQYRCSDHSNKTKYKEIAD